MPKTLRPDQVKALEVLAKDTSGLLASGLGTGKTLMAVERVRRLNLSRVPRILVVAPLNTHEQWRDAFSDQYPNLARSPRLRIIGTKKSDPESWEMLAKKGPGVFIISWEAMRGRVDAETKAAYSNASTKIPKLTKAAIRQAMRDGKIPPWNKVGKFDLIIADEIHRISNRSSTQKNVLSMIQADHKLALSWTPSGNREEGMWSVLNWLWPDKYPRFWDWARENLVVEVERFSTRAIRKVAGELRPGAIWEGIPCVVRYRTEDLGIKMPRLIERITRVPMGKIQQEQYQDFEEESFAWLDDHPVGTPLPITQKIRLRQAALGQLKATEVVQRIDYRLSKQEERVMKWWKRYQEENDICLTEYFVELYNADLPKSVKPIDESRLFAILKKAEILERGIEYEDIMTEEMEIGFNEKGEQPKLDAIKEILQDLPDYEPVLIFTHSGKWARMAADQLNAAKIYGEARAWTGALTAKRRSQIRKSFGVLTPKEKKSQFSHEGMRVLICQIQAVGEGLDDFQHRCHCEIWASPSENGVINEQAEGRLYRPGQKHSVQRWILRSASTVDEDVAESLEARWRRMRRFYKDDVA